MSKEKHRQFEEVFKTKTTLTKDKKVSLLNIIKALMVNPLSEEFRQPLDWKERGLTNYDVIIHQPMDLTTVKKALKKEMYHSIEDCLNDIELIFQNSKHYNRGTTWIEDLTDKCEKAFLKLVKNYLPQIRASFDSENKKSIKAKKMRQKQANNIQQVHDKQNCAEAEHQQNAKLEQLNEQTAVPTEADKQVKQTQQILKLRTQFFDLTRDASQSSLQIAYLIIKGEDLTVINTEKNGNCKIDVKKLSEPILNKLIDFLKQQKQKETHEQNKQNLVKKKRNQLVEKSRYEI